MGEDDSGLWGKTSRDSDQPAEMQLRKMLGQYRLDRRLGRGGMAEVFAASHHGAAGFERAVCLKRILTHLSKDGEFREMFMREARLAGKLVHSNLVQVFDCIEVENGATLAIVMEMIDGVDLKGLLDKLKEQGELMPHDVVAFVAGQILSGLCYAHGQRVVHRDISPHNVLISRQGEVKLTDFGIAKAILTHATRTGTLRGKLAYMSPEQASGKPIDWRTDLYSAGLVIYEMALGKRFFPKTNRWNLITIVAKAEQPKLEGVEPELAALIERLLAPDLEHRFQNAAESLGALPCCPTIGPVGAQKLAALLHRLEPTAEPTPPLVDGVEERTDILFGAPRKQAEPSGVSGYEMTQPAESGVNNESTDSEMRPTIPSGKPTEQVAPTPEAPRQAAGNAIELPSVDTNAIRAHKAIPPTANLASHEGPGRSRAGTVMALLVIAAILMLGLGIGLGVGLHPLCAGRGADRENAAQPAREPRSPR